MSVGLVTDSTAVLPPEQAADAGIRVVPLHLLVDGEELVDGEQVSTARLAEAMRSRKRVSTSRPTPHALLRAYEQLAADGADEIVSVHISGALSGTSDSARSAAVDSPVPVRVVDSRSLAMGLGYGVLAGAEVAASGAGADEVVAEVERVCGGTSLLVYVDTLEHLRRGGRIGGAAALLGSALAIKPLLQIVDGSVEPLEKVRTAGKALARLETLCATRAEDMRARGDEPQVVVQHLDAEGRGDALAEGLSSRLDIPVELREVGGVIGAHVGPGTISVVIAPS